MTVHVGTKYTAFTGRSHVDICTSSVAAIRTNAGSGGANPPTRVERRDAQRGIRTTKTMKRRLANAAALAAPAPVLGHILSEAIASGHGILAVAYEPSHLYQLAASLIAVPLWRRAAAARRLSVCIFAFTAVTLLFEGNGLSLSMLAVALALAALMTWVCDSAVKAALCTIDAATPMFGGMPRARALASTGVTMTGPYYAYVAAHGNRPPPSSPRS